jgi:hypothetical protein
MSLAHLTLPSQQVQQTASFLEKTLGYSRDPVPANVPMDTVWLNIGPGQQIHVFYVEGFEVSPFENEFGRHVALFYPLAGFEGLKTRLREGADIFDALRPTPFARFFQSRSMGVFEVIDEGQRAKGREGRG